MKSNDAGTKMGTVYSAAHIVILEISTTGAILTGPIPQNVRVLRVRLVIVVERLEEQYLFLKF